MPSHTDPTHASVNRPEEVHPVDDVPSGFISRTADVNATAIHYVRGGHGPTLVLLHGFPQDWYEWRRIMPRLSERFTVLAVDLPGVGGSAPRVDGYAAVDLAADVHQLVDGLNLGPAHIVGHDVGGCVAYAYARQFPEHTRTVTVMEVPIPGIAPQLSPEMSASLWHVSFHMAPDLPELLVAGRQTTYFRYFFNRFTINNATISDADVAHYAVAYREPDHLRSGFEFFRAMPTNATYNAGHTEPIGVPLLLVGGEHLFGPILIETAETLRSNYGWSTVHVQIIHDAMHYLAEERPNEVAELIEHHTESNRA